MQHTPTPTTTTTTTSTNNSPNFPKTTTTTTTTDPNLIYTDALRIPTKNTVRSLITLSEDTLASGCDNPLVSIWNTTNGTLIKELKGHTGWVISLAL